MLDQKLTDYTCDLPQADTTRERLASYEVGWTGSDSNDSDRKDRVDRAQLSSLPREIQDEDAGTNLVAPLSARRAASRQVLMLADPSLGRPGKTLYVLSAA